jgi:NADH:ubiquinone oxidoreductase subunit C
MTLDDILASLDKRFKDSIQKIEKTSPKKAFVDMDAAKITQFVIHIFKDLGLRPNTISAVDTFGGFELLYHFSYDRSGVTLSLRALLKDRTEPTIDTITGITRSAWWIEREIHELFGINFRDNKDLRTLLLPDDWPKGVYPLRKDFIPPKRDSRGHTHKPGAA